MTRFLLIAAGLALALPLHATEGFGRGPEFGGDAFSSSAAAAAAAASAKSIAAAGASAVNGSVSGVGGAGGAGGAGGSSQVSVGGDANRAYALGMSALTSSANACQGSIAVAFLAASYTVEWCALLQRAATMRAMGFDARSVQNLLCRDEAIAASAAECAGAR
jgi:hypothetical protein